MEFKFKVSDWVKCGGEYRLDVSAGDFKVKDLTAFSADVYEDGHTDIAEVEMSIKSKTIQMSLIAEPDIRFSGSIKLKKKA